MPFTAICVSYYPIQKDSLLVRNVFSTDPSNLSGAIAFESAEAEVGIKDGVGLG